MHHSPHPIWPLLLLGGLVSLATARAQSPVFLNEVLANNTTLAVAELEGATPDWVELYNASDIEITLAGMSLSSSPAEPRKWLFPVEAKIQSHGFYIVYFDGGQPYSAFNTGFGLNANGEAVYLYDAATNLVDQVVFGLQVEDLSIGRMQVAGGPWSLTTPTRNGPNTAVTPGSAATLRINEWMADPAAGNDWFELYNPDASPVNLSGLYLSNALNKNPHKYRIPDLSFIGSGGRGFQKFVADDAATNGPNHVNFKLSKGGDDIGLFPASGAAIHSVTFTAQATGISEGFLPDGSGNRVRFDTTSTPGQSNYLPLTNTIINELLTHTDPPLEDAIELYNPTTADVSISGWFLSDSASNFKKFRIPDGTVLPARGYRVYSDHELTNSPAPFRFSSYQGDTVFLSQADAAGNLTGYRTEVEVGPAANGVSFGRYTNTDGIVEYPAQKAPTLGAANAGPLIGPLVISEIMYYPIPFNATNDNTRDEYVEIHNITGASSLLYNPLELTNTWRISGGIDFQFPPGVVLPPGGYLLLVSFDPQTNAAAATVFRDTFSVPASVPLFGPFNHKLGNSGDKVDLEKPDPIQGATHLNQGFVPYILVDRVQYSTTAPWPIAANGTGYSLQRKDAFAYGNESANWAAALPTAGRANSVAVTDHDGDGLPDDWELNYGFNPNDPTDAALDSDGDGLTNLQEYLSGTDPRDPQSVLRIGGVVKSGDAAVILFTAMAGRSYTVQFRQTLSSGAWLTLTNISALPVTQSVEVNDPGAGTGDSWRFYRLAIP